MKFIHRRDDDWALLKMLLKRGIPAPGPQPASYAGMVVLKPWGYELQVYDNGQCSLWLACLKPDAAVSMHCHQKKQAAFLPLGGNLMLRTLDGEIPLRECTAVEAGVFHSQENVGFKPSFFLEYEWPSDKSDLVRYRDRYGREGKGYEGSDRMVPLAEAGEILQLPDALRYLAGMGKAA